MAERIQPLSDVGPVRHVPAQPRISARVPSFAELVHAHLAWWKGRSGGPEREAEYDATHAAFEKAHGEIVRRLARPRPRLPSRDRLGNEE